MSVNVQSLSPGDGKTYASDGDSVEVYYRGTVKENGSLFHCMWPGHEDDQENGQTFTFRMGDDNLIKGWNMAFDFISEGEHVIFNVPGNLGYGEMGYPDDNGGYKIPPNAELTYEIKCIKINKRRAKPSARELSPEEAKAVADSWAIDLTTGSSGNGKKKGGGGKSKKGKKKKT